ncbi:MAG: hypothetical protein GX941_06280 [Candidatus Methanofastidiosa archaeon]|jgi:hypothetical protein|nr:hypothetical protein [Candidatus Methanofastidiosa archaeon]HOM96235.1 hypothetical protein [Methanofastidiosum sp.]HPC80240.1 hypothetical protein [Methanofastidiosum sp.]HRS25674.1 hypothetical protein [Methanofastidiosum sp.]
MKGVEISCPHCNKKILIPESTLVKIIETYQRDKVEETPPEIPMLVEEPEEEVSIQKLECELTSKKEQLAELMVKLERNQADFTRVVKRSIKPEDMYRIQKERTILMQKAKDLREDIASLNTQMGKQEIKSNKVKYL